MHYLIDGHNLIAKLPDLSLDDPDDEAKLVLRLKSWAAASRKRRVTVIFDGGLPGGESKNLSGGGVTAVFATAGKTADSLLITRVNQPKNPSEYTLVSSDRQIVSAARFRRMPHLSSEEFAAMLGPGPAVLQSPNLPAPVPVPAPEPPPPPPPDPRENPKLSQGELAEWLDLFGPEPVIPPKPPPPPPPPKTAEKPAPPPKPIPLTKAKRSNRKLSPDEVDEWMKLFGAEDNKDEGKNWLDG